MENRFDELAKALAGGVSRREALRRFAGGLAGALLASMGLGQRAFAAPPKTEPDSVDFCQRCRIGPGPDFGACVSSFETCLDRGFTVCGCPTFSATVPCCSLLHDCCFSQGFPGSWFCCPFGETCCLGVCVDTLTDKDNCGSCGDFCPLPQTCVNGQCCGPCGTMSCCAPKECCSYVITTPTGVVTAQNCCSPCPTGKTLDCEACTCV